MTKTLKHPIIYGVKPETAAKIELAKQYIEQQGDAPILSTELAKVLGMTQQGADDFMRRHLPNVRRIRHGDAVVENARRRGLNSDKLVEPFLHTPDTVGEIMKATGLSRSTVKNSLARQGGTKRPPEPPGGRKRN